MNAEPRQTSDPGQPTWIEAADGFAHFMRQAALRVQAAADVLSNYPPPLMPSEKPSPERLKAAGAFSAASAEWKHWNTYARRYEAFMRLHPNMRDVRIDAPCSHKGTCWTGDDDGFYREPEASSATADPWQGAGGRRRRRQREVLKKSRTNGLHAAN